MEQQPQVPAKKVLEKSASDTEQQLAMEMDQVDQQRLKFEEDEEEPSPKPKKTKKEISSVLQNVIVVISGFNPDREEELTEKVGLMGGKVFEKWNSHKFPKPTHLICNTETYEFQHVQLLGGMIVTDVRYRFQMTNF